MYFGGLCVGAPKTERRRVALRGARSRGRSARSRFGTPCGRPPESRPSRFGGSPVSARGAGAARIRVSAPSDPPCGARRGEGVGKDEGGARRALERRENEEDAPRCYPQGVGVGGDSLRVIRVSIHGAIPTGVGNPDGAGVCHTRRGVSSEAKAGVKVSPGATGTARAARQTRLEG